MSAPKRLVATYICMACDLDARNSFSQQCSWFSESEPKHLVGKDQIISHRSPDFSPDCIDTKWQSVDIPLDELNDLDHIRDVIARADNAEALVAEWEGR